MSLITDPIEIARIDAEHEAHWAKESERMEWQKEFAEGHMRIARLMLKVTGSPDFNLGMDLMADWLEQCEVGLITYDEYLERSLVAWERIAGEPSE